MQFLHVRFVFCDSIKFFFHFIIFLTEHFFTPNICLMDMMQLNRHDIAYHILFKFISLLKIDLLKFTKLTKVKSMYKSIYISFFSLIFCFSNSINIKLKTNFVAVCNTSSNYLN